MSMSSDDNMSANKYSSDMSMSSDNDMDTNAIAGSSLMELPAKMRETMKDNVEDLSFKDQKWIRFICGSLAPEKEHLNGILELNNLSTTGTLTQLLQSLICARNDPKHKEPMKSFRDLCNVDWTRDLLDREWVLDLCGSLHDYDTPNATHMKDILRVNNLSTAGDVRDLMQSLINARDDSSRQVRLKTFRDVPDTNWARHLIKKHKSIEDRVLLKKITDENEQQLTDIVRQESIEEGETSDSSLEGEEGEIMDPSLIEPTIEEGEIIDSSLVEPTIEEGEIMSPSSVEPIIEPIIEEGEIMNPSSVEPTIEDGEIMNPSSVEPTIEEGEIMNPSSVEPTIEEGEIENPSSVEPTIEEGIIMDPSLAEPTIEEGEMINPSLIESISEKKRTSDSNISNGTNDKESRTDNDKAAKKSIVSKDRSAEALIPKKKTFYEDESEGANGKASRKDEYKGTKATMESVIANRIVELPIPKKKKFHEEESKGTSGKASRKDISKCVKKATTTTESGVEIRKTEVHILPKKRRYIVDESEEEDDSNDETSIFASNHLLKIAVTKNKVSSEHISVGQEKRSNKIPKQKRKISAILNQRSQVPVTNTKVHKERVRANKRKISAILAPRSQVRSQIPVANNKVSNVRIPIGRVKGSSDIPNQKQTSGGTRISVSDAGTCVTLEQKKIHSKERSKGMNAQKVGQSVIEERRMPYKKRRVISEQVEEWFDVPKQNIHREATITRTKSSDVAPTSRNKKLTTAEQKRIISHITDIRVSVSNTQQKNNGGGENPDAVVPQPSQNKKRNTVDKKRSNTTLPKNNRGGKNNGGRVVNESSMRQRNKIRKSRRTSTRTGRLENKLKKVKVKVNTSNWMKMKNLLTTPTRVFV